MNPFYEKREQKLVARMNENMQFPEHLHEHMEILLVTEGQIGVKIMDEERVLEKGDCAVVFPEQLHSYACVSPHRIELLIFDTGMAGPYMRTLQKKQPSCPFLKEEQLSGDVRLAFERILELSEGSGPEGFGDASLPEEDKRALLGGWIQILLASVMPQLKPRERRSAESMDLIGKLLVYVTEHFQEQLTLELLAKELHVNKYYVSHLFAERLQMNFRQYLNHIRLEYALQLMYTTDWSLTRIWEEAGFNSQRSFNRFFRENMGMSPTEYREKESELEKTN